MPIRAGRLRHRGVIQTATETQSASGFPAPTWSTYAERWGSLEGVSGREFFAARQTASEATHQWIMRYTPGVTTKMRLLVGTRVFDIESVTDPDGRKRETHMVVVERPEAGPEAAA